MGRARPAAARYTRAAWTAEGGCPHMSCDGRELPGNPTSRKRREKWDTPRFVVARWHGVGMGPCLWVGQQIPPASLREGVGMTRTFAQRWCDE